LPEVGNGVSCAQKLSGVNMLIPGMPRKVQIFAE